MVDNNGNITKNEPFLTEIEGAVLVLLKSFHDRYDKTHSLQFTLEDCLVTGITAKQRSKDYSEKIRDDKEFKRQLAADPTIMLDFDKFLRLQLKYGQIDEEGASKVRAAHKAMTTGNGADAVIPPSAAQAA